MIAHKLNDLIRDKVQSLKLCRSDYFYSSLILSAKFVLIASRNIWPFLSFENKPAERAKGFYDKKMPSQTTDIKNILLNVTDAENLVFYRFLG